MTSRPTSSRLVPFWVLVAACEWGGGPGSAPNSLFADAARIDSPKQADAPRSIDSGGTDGKEADAHIFMDAPALFDAKPDASIDAPAGKDHVLLTEVSLAPSAGELIEIYNPTPEPVDLSTYFISNHGDYFLLPSGSAGSAIPQDHFIVQFPAGTTIATNQVITVTTGSGSGFLTNYGVAPDFSITDGTITHIIGTGTPQLTDSGAFIVLFQWDGAAGIVRDVDMMIVGQPSGTNQLINKSGVTQKGDTYATDADTIAQQSATPGVGFSTKRISAEVGHETQNGAGNGITGHDETSENTSVTWDSTFTAPTPGTVPAGL